VRAVSWSIVVAGPAIEAEQLWHDRSRWASWVNGFGHLQRIDDDWPQPGARRMWVTKPGFSGPLRGLIAETVREQRAGQGHTIAIEDERVGGTQRVTFAGDATRTRVTVTLELEPKTRMPPGRRWWLRRQLRQHLERTLTRFSYELAAER